MSTDNFKPGDVFADIRSDFAFKRAFGTPKYKDATIGLLNAFITDRHIVDVSFDNTEILPETSSSRKSVIDVLCTDDTGAQCMPVSAPRSADTGRRWGQADLTPQAIPTDMPPDAL